jgi:hypothetical protein
VVRSLEGDHVWTARGLSGDFDRSLDGLGT